MLKRIGAFVSLLRFLFDLTFLCIFWIAVYPIRFNSGLFSIARGVPSWNEHVVLIPPVLLLCAFGCVCAGLYRTKRVRRLYVILFDISKACFFSGLFISAFFYYLHSLPYSRKLIAIYIVMMFCGLFFSNICVMAALRVFRKRGYNLRHYAVVGAGLRGQKLVEEIQKNPWLGLRCAFFIDEVASGTEKRIAGIPVYGPFSEMEALAKKHRIDELYLTLVGEQVQEIQPYLKKIQMKGVTIRLVPDWGDLLSLNTQIVRLGSIVLFSAGDSPLEGYHIVLKEMFDRIAAGLLLILFFIPMLIAAILIKCTSKGPVFYRQIRIGMNQKPFRILKFRTMYVESEKNSGRRWTIPGDSRCTWFGKWLRRMSLDELPQLFNVLRGEMSLVGPRPERPCFVRQFSKEYRTYMLRHKVKAGITGWAQVNGFRGDTSLRKRLQYDLFYIRNWSFLFDLRILLMTPMKVFFGKNAY